jgi:2,3-bisphosphoglycerate-independent phosphoglycerate mutase
MQRRRPVMLAILDGWGWREDAADNAVKQARTPNFDRQWASCPNALLHTSGKDVGLLVVLPGDHPRDLFEADDA